jgi:hypothetical protein
MRAERLCGVDRVELEAAADELFDAIYPETSPRW